MKIFLKRAALIFSLWALVSVFAFNNFAEAKASITWTTTDVILDVGKCTVKGYFTNNGDTGGTVTKMKFIVDTKESAQGTSLYSAVWEYSPNDCYIPAGAQISWSFWHNDKLCPSWSKSLWWSVNRTVWTK